jgi:hypothetical protein
MYDILAQLAAHSGTATLSAASATAALVINKFWFSKKEKKIENREDFKAITDSLFRELAELRQDAQNCDNKYSELQDKFLEFKSKYNELELRYQIQININKKLSEEIKNLEGQIQTHLDKEANEQKRNN